MRRFSAPPSPDESHLIAFGALFIFSVRVTFCLPYHTRILSDPVRYDARVEERAD
ncbi:MAG TPA: hypothetical protein VEO56_06140 [Bacteroidota bacterium]|nr:hypothetical protein [Bacteroidota bacterium]